MGVVEAKMEHLEAKTGQWHEIDARIIASLAPGSTITFENKAFEPLSLPWQLSRLSEKPSAVPKVVRYAGRIDKKPGAWVEPPQRAETACDDEITECEASLHK